MMIATPSPKKPNIEMGTQRGLVLYDSGMGGVYLSDGGWVTRPVLEAPLTLLRRFFASATAVRIGVLSHG